MINLRHEQLLTLRQAAERLGRHPSTVRDYISRGLLDGIRVAGGPWQTSVEALERASLLADSEQPAVLPLTAAQIERAHQEAEEQLLALGILRRKRKG